MVKVQWQPLAIQDLQDIYHYYKNVKLSWQTANHIKQDIFEAAYTLETFPECGTIEPSLQGETVFRYLVVRRHYKIIYFVDQSVCHIVAIWDCRNNPDKLTQKMNR